MSDLDLDAIRERAHHFAKARAVRTRPISEYGLPMAAVRSAEDVPSLLVEVERLRREIDGWRVAEHVRMDGQQPEPAIQYFGVGWD